MFYLTEPSNQTIAEFIESQKRAPFTYKGVGATNGFRIPPGYTVDHNRVKLGRGVAIYRRACQALREWKQFDLGWVTLVPAGVPLEVGVTVAVKARAFGTWSLSAAQVVYLINKDGPTRRFGFAYGTLPDHVESGEERFTIEHYSGDDSVWYDILAFSRPRHPLVRMSFPLARMLQKRFAKESLRRMIRECSESTQYS